MAILIEMSRWITYSGPTQENWNLRWYPDVKALNSISIL